MQASLHHDVLNKILKARIALALRQPFLASAIMRLPIKDATNYGWCQTMATDGYHIFYNAKWAGALSASELRGVLAHEVLHVIFQHASRRMNRDPLVWNIAADHAINLLLIEQNFHLPQNGLADSSYFGMSTEQIYAILPKTITYKDPSYVRNRTSDDGTEDSGNIPNIGLDVIDPDSIGVIALRDPDMPDKEQLSELCEGLRIDASSKLQGSSARHFFSECQAIQDSKIDWRDLLRCWLIDRIKTDWSMWPYSKKHIHRGLFMPSIGIEAPGHLVFAVDTSGSMSVADLADIYSEIRIYRETFPCRLTIIQADDEIHTVTTFEELDGEEIPANVQLAGRGGTDFRPVFKWIGDNAPGAYLIYATDGFGSFPETAETGGVIWVLTKYHKAIDEFPFGACVMI